MRWWPCVYLSVLLLMVAASDAAAQATREQIARGKYVFGAAAGCGCHTVPKQPLNAGGRKYDGPFGTVYSIEHHARSRPPGSASGRTSRSSPRRGSGRRPNGERLIPVHPYTVFNGMAEQDLKGVVAYLRSVPPVQPGDAAKKISVPLFESVFLPAWLAAFAPRRDAAPIGGDLGRRARRVPGARGRATAASATRPGP